MNQCQEIDRARAISEKVSTEFGVRCPTKAHRENSHCQQIQLTDAVLRFNSAARCSDGYVIVVNCGCDWRADNSREDTLAHT